MEQTQQVLTSLKWLLVIHLVSGSEDRHVLPAHQARRQPHPVHAGQGEAKGGVYLDQRHCGENPRARLQGAQQGCHGVLLGKQRRVRHVRLLNTPSNLLLFNSSSFVPTKSVLFFTVLIFSLCMK